MQPTSHPTADAEQQKHPFHLVDPSPWPIITAFSVLVLAVGGVLIMHDYGALTFGIGCAMVLLSAFLWWRDVIREANTPGVHTRPVQNGLRIGMVLFILSELMLFVSLFWAYFHSALSPAEATGGIWPPQDIETLDPFHLPYFNTLLLLLSGTSVTWAHHALLEGDRKGLIQGLSITVLLGITFSIVQAIEYGHAAFSMRDGIYPSVFYLATGFHGAHVIIGTVFLAVCLLRAYRNEFTPKHHVGFEVAAWYWHFVDVVWLFLFLSIYWWGYRPVL